MYALVPAYILLATICLGLIGLPLLRKFTQGQVVREDGPKSHFKKSGTTTFGGLFFVLPWLVSAFILPLLNPSLLSYSVAFVPAIGYALIGFLDDYIKTAIDKGGLRVKQKVLWLGLITALFAIYYLWLAPIEPFLLVPFVHNPIAVNGWGKVIYFVFIVLYMFYVANATNLNDGVDGLCSSLGVTSSLIVAVVLWHLGKIYTDLTLSVINPLLLATGALAAGCLGFFIFNKHPAKIFMGDTGSQGIGAAFAAICLLAGVPWVVLFATFIYLLEGLSVMLQVIYFRKTGGKRLFRMAPLHHHYELGGFSEWKIVGSFNLVQLLIGLLGVAVVYVVVR